MFRTDQYNTRVSVEKAIAAHVATVQTNINNALGTSYTIAFRVAGATEQLPAMVRLVWPNKGGRVSRLTKFTVVIDVLTRREAGNRGNIRLSELICENLIEEMGFGISKAHDYTIIPVLDYFASISSPPATNLKLICECPNGFEQRQDPDPDVMFYQAILKLFYRK